MERMLQTGCVWILANANVALDASDNATRRRLNNAHRDNKRMLS